MTNNGQGLQRVLSFRPFRRVDNKLVVTSYMGWRKIYTANYDGAVVKLLPFPKIKNGEVVYSMGKPDGQYGFWHPTKFEPLFWPINGKIRYKHYSESRTILDTLPIQDDEVYSMFDCDGCPCFSHKTVVYVSENYPDKMHLFEPLTADIVYEYFELMRDQLGKVKWLGSIST